MGYPSLRMRRWRRTQHLRDLVSEVRLELSNLVYPIFVDEGADSVTPIASMPGISRFPISRVAEEARDAVEKGVRAVLLFGVPYLKDEVGSGAFLTDGVIQKAIRKLKREFGDEVVVMADVCLCEYTSHGHCGVIKGSEVVNDLTLSVLQKVAVSQAEAGVDVVAPSAMMDGQVKAIREALDDSGHDQTAILSYSAKYASGFYSCFREAARCAPKQGDRRGYQMDYRNAREALREMELDLEEGADAIMVKPALAYLDIIRLARDRLNAPIAAYNVSGEYAMVKAAAQNGWVDEKAAALEILTGIKRAGADIIITYFAKDVKRWMETE
ncbi:MAG: porphobilinogen synthase [Candidatus Verstraetearchaeota archaeon]|nr:porphobilinogen synthase [Candidatus Verstraetearchaeota archaeon]